MKLLGLDAAVNVTIGLPFLRSSVDHGTAFDIAGAASRRRPSAPCCAGIWSELTSLREVGQDHQLSAATLIRMG